jgi:hypothetical protein
MSNDDSVGILLNGSGLATGAMTGIIMRTFFVRSVLESADHDCFCGQSYQDMKGGVTCRWLA